MFVTSGDWATNLEPQKQLNPEEPTFIDLVSLVFEPGCVDTSSRSTGASHESTHRSSSGGVYFLSLRLPERLSHHDATAATFYTSFGALNSSFAAFQWMERDVMPLQERWAEKLDFLATGHERHHHRQQQHMSRTSEDPESPARGAAFSTEIDSSSAADSAVRWGNLRGKACRDWWQVGSPVLGNPSRQSGVKKSTDSLKADLHLNANALYALRCPAFDEYRTLV